MFLEELHNGGEGPGHPHDEAEKLRQATIKSLKEKNPHLFEYDLEKQESLNELKKNFENVDWSGLGNKLFDYVEGAVDPYISNINNIITNIKDRLAKSKVEELPEKEVKELKKEVNRLSILKRNLTFNKKFDKSFNEIYDESNEYKGLEFDLRPAEVKQQERLDKQNFKKEFEAQQKSIAQKEKAEFEIAELEDNQVQELQNQGYIVEEVSEPVISNFVYPEESFQERYDREWKMDQSQDALKPEYFTSSNLPLLNLDGTDPDADYKEWIDQNIDYGTNINKSLLTYMTEGVMGIPDLLTEKIPNYIEDAVADLKDKWDKTSILPANIAKPKDYIEKYGWVEGTKEYLISENSKHPITMTPEQNNLLVKNEKLNDNLQELTYKLGDPDIDSSEKAKYQNEFNRIVKEKQSNVNQINKIRGEQVGGFDIWFNTVVPGLLNQNSLLKLVGLDDAGSKVKAIANKVGAVDPLEMSQVTLPKFDTYAHKLERETDHYLEDKRFDDLDPDKKAWHRWRYRASASNKDPFKVSLYGTRGERKLNAPNILGQGALLHFMDQSPLTGYQHPKTRNFIKNLKSTDYIGVLEKSKDDENVYALKYKQRKDVKSINPKNTFYIRTNKFDNINFKGRTRDYNFPGHFYWTLKSSGNAAIPISRAADPNIYSVDAGQAVVFIFKYTPKSGKIQQRYIHFAGSPNEIKKQGFRIKEDYNLKDNKLIIGIADAGSFSSSIRSDAKGRVNNELLNSVHYGYWNPTSFAGAGAVLLE